MAADTVVWFYPLGATEPESLGNFYDIRITRQRDAESNGLNLVLVGEDVLSEGDLRFPLDSTFKVFCVNGGLVDTANPDHLLGTFTLLNYDLSPDEGKITLELGDKTYNMLSKITVIKDTTRTAPELINNIVQQINETGESTQPVTTQIAQTKSDGSPFTPVDYTVVYENGYGAVKELSQPEYTGDDLPYHFWFDENGVFYWQYPGQSPKSLTFEYGKDPITSFKAEKQESSSISMVIYNAGEDLDGNERLNFVLDPTASSVKNKMTYQPMTDVTNLVRQTLKEQYGLADTENSTLKTVIDNDTFIQKMDSLSRARCFRIFDNVGQGLWNVTMDVIGARYDVGGLYTVKAPEWGFSEKNLRMKRVVHKINKDGWNTRLDLEEDPARVS